MGIQKYKADLEHLYATDSAVGSTEVVLYADHISAVRGLKEALEQIVRMSCVYTSPATAEGKWIVKIGDEARAALNALTDCQGCAKDVGIYPPSDAGNVTLEKLQDWFLQTTKRRS